MLRSKACLSWTAECAADKHQCRRSTAAEDGSVVEGAPSHPRRPIHVIALWAGSLGHAVLAFPLQAGLAVPCHPWIWPSAICLLWLFANTVFSSSSPLTSVILETVSQSWYFLQILPSSHAQSSRIAHPGWNGRQSHLGVPYRMSWGTGGKMR